MNRFRIVSLVHDVKIRLPDFVTLSEQFLGVSSVMDPAFRGNKTSYNLLISINRDRCFQEMFSNLPGSFREIMAAVPTCKSGRIDSRYRNIFIGSIEQVHGLSEGEPKIECFYPTEKFLERCEMGYC
jgi:hypothetical protein